MSAEKNISKIGKFRKKFIIFFFFSLKSPEYISFKYENMLLWGIFVSFFFFFSRFISIFFSSYYEITVYGILSLYWKKIAILLFFIHLVILIYPDILYKIQPSLLTGYSSFIIFYYQKYLASQSFQVNSKL